MPDTDPQSTLVPLHPERQEETSIANEMRTAYLDYAMSVIVSRALPDVRDGLKPVHRRILFAMWNLGLKSGAKFRKSATIVGEVLGKYHPHGDAAVYDSMVRLAQDFAQRYTFVWGQGNFGSMDGDSAAAYRYTEAKLRPLAEEMLLDIDKDTVNLKPTFDDSHKEPVVLPAKLPNLLINGTLGIAVGMATNIPTHNLVEVCQGAMHLIDNPEATVDDLMNYIKGPDFPTGGIIYDNNEIKRAYSTGKGSIVMRAKTEIDENKGKPRIIVSEIPYQVNKSTLVEKIASLVQEKKVKDIRDLRDESNKHGVRIVIDLKKECYPKKVLNQLFKSTQLQETFHVNMLALVEGGLQPRVLTLKAILQEYINHREEVIRRRSEFDLKKTKERAHVLEGLVKALDAIDAVIKTIKASKDKAAAKEALMKKFDFTEMQTDAILEMRLHQLANLERQKIEDELAEKKKIIKELESILASKPKRLGIIKSDLQSLIDQYGDERRTDIVKGTVGEFKAEDLIANEEAIILRTRDGYVKRLDPETFKTQGRGGKGVIGVTAKEDDIVEQFFATMTHDDLLFFTSRGRVFKMKAYEIPVSTRTAKGQALVNFLQLGPREVVSAVISLDPKTTKTTQYLAMVTSQGLIKKVTLADFANIRSSGLIAIKLKGEDSLEYVKSTSGKDDIIIVTQQGQAIRFKESDVRPMGRVASGVRAIRLRGNDRVTQMDVLDKESAAQKLEVFVIAAHGYGKRTAISAYKVQLRGGSGIKAMKITDKTGIIVRCTVTSPEDHKKDVIIISEKGQVIRFPLHSVPTLGRDTQGVRLMKFKESGDNIASLTIVGA